HGVESERFELHLGIGPFGGAVVATLPGRVDRAHKVEVLRHRLLRQSHGFEGDLAIAVELSAGDRPVAERPYSSAAYRHLLATSLAASKVADKQKNPLPEVDGILDLCSIRRPGRQPVEPPRSEPVDAAIGGPATDAIYSDDLKIGVKERGQRLGQSCP